MGGRVLHDHGALPEQQPQGQAFRYLEFLRSRIRLTEVEAKYYLLQVIDALEYLHASGIVHRDIKLGNVFLNYKMEIKLGDFGLSTRVKSARERRYTTCGTPNYIAPEILNETGHSFEVDIWAVGIMLYALLVGKPPFESETVDETYRRIKNNHYDFPKQIPLSSEAKQLIKLLLDPNPKTRISIQQIRGCDFLTSQKIPPSMPPYTISLPPQSSFLKQYGSEKGAKLAIYPRKVSATLGTEDFHNSNANLRHKPKLSRVLSCDKNIFKLSAESKSSYLRDQSELNRGVVFNTRMKNHLQQSKASLANELSPRSSRHEQDGNEIICYYDMSAKYGIGYLLSNGNFGVVFNDQTSLTALADDCWLYYDRTAVKLSLLPESLRKKGEILRLCSDKLCSYKEKNVLIAFGSEVFAMGFVRSKEMFIMKLSNGVLQFFWGCDVLTVKGFRWVKWRIGREEGECALNSSTLPQVAEAKVAIVRDFLRR